LFVDGTNYGSQSVPNIPLDEYGTDEVGMDTSGQNDAFKPILVGDFRSPDNSDAASKSDSSLSGESEDGNDNMKISTYKASEDTQRNANDIIVEMNTYIGAIEHTLGQIHRGMENADELENIEGEIRVRNNFIFDHFEDDPRFFDIVEEFVVLTDGITQIKEDIQQKLAEEGDDESQARNYGGDMSAGGATRKRGRRRARKRTHRKPVQRKRKRTQRNAAQRKRNNIKRTRRRR
jgi:hypothetical protein